VVRVRSRGGCLVVLLAVVGALWGPATAAADVTAYDATDTSGLSDFGHTQGATVADFNGDSWDDVLLIRHYDSFPRLYLNDSGVFSWTGPGAFPNKPEWRDYHSCPPADVDGNGLLDLYCTTGGLRGGTGPNPNELWLQTTPGQFTEQAGAWGVLDPYGRGRGATFLFADGDARPDLYVTNQYPRLDRKPGPNRLFLNVDGSRFVPAPQFGLNGRLGGESVQQIDFDADGDDDVLLCGRDALILFENHANQRFTRMTRRQGIPVNCAEAVLAPFTPDARPDLVVVSPNGLRVVRQRPNHTFRNRAVVARRVKRATQVATGDINADGHLDLYVLRSGRFKSSKPRDAQVDLADKMFVNTGAGRVRAKPIPQSLRGIGEAVTAIDHDRNGLTDFIVQNGERMASGPTSLVAFRDDG